MQGMLILRDYKTARDPRGWRLKREREAYLAGRELQLPLYARIAASHFRKRVFGFGGMHTALNADPRLFAAATLSVHGNGLTLDPWYNGRKDPIIAAAAATSKRAADLVGGIAVGISFRRQIETALAVR